MFHSELEGPYRQTLYSNCTLLVTLYSNCALLVRRALCQTLYTNCALLVLNGTSLNSVNALLAPSRRVASCQVSVNCWLFISSPTQTRDHDGVLAVPGEAAALVRRDPPGPGRHRPAAGHLRRSLILPQHSAPGSREPRGGHDLHRHGESLHPRQELHKHWEPLHEYELQEIGVGRLERDEQSRWGVGRRARVAERKRNRERFDSPWEVAGGEVHRVLREHKYLWLLIPFTAKRSNLYSICVFGQTTSESMNHQRSSPTMHLMQYPWSTQCTSERLQCWVRPRDFLK